jgi:hypothetical protein
MRDLEGTLERAMAELTLKQEANTEAWGFGSLDRWDADLDLGVIRFSNADGFKVTGQVQVVGTYDTEDGSWLWGWDHPSVPEPLAQAAELARQFGEMHGLGRYKIRMVRCTEDHAAEFAAVALHLSGGTGVYRGPFGDASFMYMTFRDVVITRPD